jgi:SOS-response transcriptional repressor LexA
MPNVLGDVSDATLICEMWRRGYSVAKIGGFGLTGRQLKVFEFIRDRMAEGLPAPSMREIAAHLGGKASASSGHRIVKTLVERGVVKRLPNRARSVTLADGTWK